MIRRLVGAAVAVLVGLLAGCAARAHAGSAQTPSYQGHRWRVTEVRALHPSPHDIALQPSDHPWIAFDRGHRLTAYDLVDHYQLSYRATEKGFLPEGYRGSAGWVGSRHDQRISFAVTEVIGDRFHPVDVRSLADGSITLTAFFHDRKGDSTWHPVVELVCRRDDSRDPVGRAPSDSTSSPSR